MNLRDLKALFPHASRDVLRLNCEDIEDHLARLRAKVTKPPQRKALGTAPARSQQSQKSGKGYYRITYECFSVKPLDWDNAAAAVKRLQDVLVEEGLLPNDGWKTLEGGVACRKVAKVEEERIEITIQRLH